MFKEENVDQNVFANLSQSAERMGWTKHMPCVTPRGEFFHVGEERYLTGQGAKKRVQIMLKHVNNAKV